MPLKSSPTSPRLRFLPNEEFDAVERLARARGIDLDQCPTCHQHQTELAPGIREWTNVHCDCERQCDLQLHYLHANIPAEYWRISFGDFYGDPAALTRAREFLGKWGELQYQGIGVRFYSPQLAVGKTTLAVLVPRH